MYIYIYVNKKYIYICKQKIYIYKCIALIYGINQLLIIEALFLGEAIDVCLSLVV